jgi:LysM repeat protein
MAFRTIQIDIEDAVFQSVLNRAAAENKAIGELVAEFLYGYAPQSPTVAPEEPQSTPTPPPTVPDTIYVVQSGDTLGRIAKKFYGNARKYPVIQKANNITDAGRIWVGQKLTIPTLAESQPEPAIVTSPPPSVPSPVVPVVSPITQPQIPSPPTRPGEPPTKPSIQWVGSPNFNRRRQPDDITAVVIHATANSTLQGVIDWFNNPSAQVSAHYTIDKDGKVVQHVKDTDRAWHAGRSVWKGRNSVNDYGLGIELVNLNDGRDPYPEAQHQANVALCAWLCHQYNISVDEIMGHVDIALPPGRKSDPRRYDLEKLRSEVAALLEA